MVIPISTDLLYCNNARLKVQQAIPATLDESSTMRPPPSAPPDT